jgi:hypothetical protein
VYAERRSLAAGQPEALVQQALFVETVARFVERAEERAREAVRVVTRGQANIVRADVGTEWMIGDIQPA